MRSGRALRTFRTGPAANVSSRTPEVSTASPPASEYSSRTLRFSHVLEVVHIEAIYRLPRQDERHAAIAVAIAGLRDVCAIVAVLRVPPSAEVESERVERGVFTAGRGIGLSAHAKPPFRP
jgi:hypothetical protein